LWRNIPGLSLFFLGGFCPISTENQFVGAHLGVSSTMRSLIRFKLDNPDSPSIAYIDKGVFGPIQLLLYPPNKYSVVTSGHRKVLQRLSAMLKHVSWYRTSGRLTVFFLYLLLIRTKLALVGEKMLLISLIMTRILQCKPEDNVYNSKISFLRRSLHSKEKINHMLRSYVTRIQYGSLCN
jgi:hypothetical protein